MPSPLAIKLTQAIADAHDADDWPRVGILRELSGKLVASEEAESAVRRQRWAVEGRVREVLGLNA